ncbi:MAG: AAA family ATPase, partial [Prevotellaceae bacterium]|nr:AAA family ATPase [Prevotellaceae bacterium]
MLQNLPVGMQSFEKLRKREGIYVDKTQYILQMLSSTGTIYFLSRPRRFGKSLLISTLEAVFQGQKELFEGLYIYDKWNWNEKFPVIHLDFGDRDYGSGEELKLSLNGFVDSTAQDNQISLIESTLSGKFSELIKKLHKTTGQQVVVLIDEYDKPITDNLSDPKVMGENKTALHNFYQVLKATD